MKSLSIFVNGFFIGTIFYDEKVYMEERNLCKFMHGNVSIFICDIDNSSFDEENECLYITK